MNKARLGKGLEALISSELKQEIFSNKAQLQYVAIDKIKPNVRQPRQNFDEEKIGELSNSLKEQGLIQPLALRPLSQNYYELVAGERRWRAAKMAGFTEVPAVIRQVSNQEMLAFALIENLQREDLNPIEEALAYKQLQDEFSLTQEEVAHKVGKSRSQIANIMRLLALPVSIQEMVRRKELSYGHARTLLILKSKAQQERWAKRAVAEQLSVRDLEKLLTPPKSGKRSISPKEVNPHLQKIESDWQRKLSTKVKMTKKRNKGKIEIFFYNDEDLERINAILFGEA